MKLISVRLVFLRFKPKCIDDSEEHRKAETEHPGEIPHGSSFLSVEGLVVGRDEFARNLAAHDVIRPTGVGENNGDEYNRYPEHDVQRHVA